MADPVITYTPRWAYQRSTQTNREGWVDEGGEFVVHYPEGQTEHFHGELPGPLFGIYAAQLRAGQEAKVDARRQKEASHG